VNSLLGSLIEIPGLELLSIEGLVTDVKVVLSAVGAHETETTFVALAGAEIGLS
jgi:hypothetical protein